MQQREAKIRLLVVDDSVLAQRALAPIHDGGSETEVGSSHSLVSWDSLPSSAKRGFVFGEARPVFGEARLPAGLLRAITSQISEPVRA
jgi:hypothetical protein